MVDLRGGNVIGIGAVGLGLAFRASRIRCRFASAATFPQSSKLCRPGAKSQKLAPTLVARFGVILQA